jgi:AraC family transcriptional regulator
MSESGDYRERGLVLEHNTGRKRPVRANEPELSSARAGWKGLLVEEHPADSNELDQVSTLDHTIFVQLDGSASLDWRSDGLTLSRTLAPGNVGIIPAGLTFSSRYRGEGGVLAVHLEPSVVTAAAIEVSGSDRVELLTSHGNHEPLIRELAMGLREEARGPVAEGRLYAEALGSALAAHLVRRHSISKPTTPRTGGLSKIQLRRVIEFIHERLADDISLDEIASVAQLSQFHFSRLFKQSTNSSVHEYVTRCRVERAKQLLASGELTITDVALQVGFYDQSHLTHHFRRVLGTTPGAFAREMRSRRVVVAAGTKAA